MISGFKIVVIAGLNHRKYFLYSTIVRLKTSCNQWLITWYKRVEKCVPICGNSLRSGTYNKSEHTATALSSLT